MTKKKKDKKPIKSSKGYIIAPSYGRVVSVDSKEVAIFIPFKANHDIFSPIDGKVIDIEAKKGGFTKQYYQTNSRFTKKGKVEFDIDGDIPIKLETYVGFPYRPNRIRVDTKEGRKVKKGQKIAEILLGSLSETEFPDKNVEIIPLVKRFQKVEGGKTKIAEWRKTKKIKKTNGVIVKINKKDYNNWTAGNYVKSSKINIKPK